MATLKEFIRTINEQVEDYIDEHFEEVRPDALGLDNRSATRMFANREAIAVRDYDEKTANYYGGLEYVDSKYVNRYGNFVIYYNNDHRIQEAIDCLYDGEIEFDDEE
jgi:hypothetical protein